jgi:hypothetical protein
MLVRLGPQAGSETGGAGIPDRDRAGEFHRQAARQAGALGDEDVAVEDADGALAVALDGHRPGQRRRPPQRDLGLATEVGGDEAAGVAAVGAVRRAAETGRDNQYGRHV